MENFYYEDQYCSDISDLLFALEYEDEDVRALPDDWKLTVMETREEKMFVLTQAYIADELHEHTTIRWEERYPEESAAVDAQIRKAIREAIDIDKLNSAIPSLHYPADAEITITKADLLQYIN